MMYKNKLVLSSALRSRLRFEFDRCLDHIFTDYFLQRFYGSIDYKHEISASCIRTMEALNSRFAWRLGWFVSEILLFSTPSTQFGSILNIEQLGSVAVLWQKKRSVGYTTITPTKSPQYSPRPTAIYLSQSRHPSNLTKNRQRSQLEAGSASILFRSSIIYSFASIFRRKRIKSSSYSPKISTLPSFKG